ncbi:MAG: 3-keto-disaccharide hydrolase, partial [Planctomycetota bacterium]
LEDPERRAARLALEARGGAISGRAEDADGRPFEIRDAKLSGSVLELTAVSKEHPDFRPRARFEIRGDRLLGKLELSPGESDPHAVEMRGERERRWGEPVALLAAESTEGWKPRNPAAKFGWKVSGGVLRNSPPDIDIVSEKRFRDFKLHLEYRVRPGSNSGIYLRGRYELQVLGDPRVQPHGNMAVYSVLSPTKNPMKPFEEWQSVDVTLIGRWLTVVLNGEVVHEDAYLPGITGGATDPWEEEPGPILLQGDHGPIEFRNIVVVPAL